MRVVSSTRLPWRLTQVMCHVEEAVYYGLSNITGIRLEKFKVNIGTKKTRSAGISWAPLINPLSRNLAESLGLPLFRGFRIMIDYNIAIICFRCCKSARFAE